MTAKDRLRHILNLASQYHLYYIEDPFDEATYEGQNQLFEELGSACLITSGTSVKNDTDESRVSIHVKKGNLALIAPTRTISSVFKAYAVERSNGRSCAILTDYSTTCERSPSHLAVALSAPFIKLSVSDRQCIAKINELLRIEQELFDGKSNKIAKKPI